jgi:hypothetical protein
MPMALGDLYPVGRDGPSTWLLLPNDEPERKDDHTQQFYLYRADLRILYPNTHPLQVWVKFLHDPRYVTPLDKTYFYESVWNKPQEAGHE